MNPIFSITADGQDVTANISDRLISLDLVDRSGTKSDRLTITVDDRDQVLEIPRKGAKLALQLGFEQTGLVAMGTYVVNDVDLSGPVRTMVIRAGAVDMGSEIKSPKERSWHDTTVGDVAKKIASEHGLKASIDPQIGGINIDHEDQTESDMQFLARLCMGMDCVFKVADGNLIIAQTYSGKSSSGKAVETVQVYENGCSTWSAQITRRGKYGKSRARWYDPQKGGDIESETEGSDKPELLLSKTYKNKDEAKRAAKSALNANQASTGKLSIRGVTGNPALSAECKLQLNGFRVGVDELEWFVETVRHSLTKSGGYICDIDAETKEAK